MGYIIVALSLLAVIVAAWLVRPAMFGTDNALAAFTRRAVIGLCAAFLLAMTLLNSMHQVPAGHVGLVYTFGAITGQRGDGLQWTLPWQDVRDASIQVQGHHFKQLNSFSSETQDVFVAATVNVQVSPDAIQSLYRYVGPDYFNILVSPRVLQAFKDETVKYTSVEIAPHRENIRKAVRERLTRELKENSIAVQDLLIDNISFQKGFQDSIEAKQRNTQLALAEKENVEKEKHIAQQKIEQARGEGQATLERATKQAEANEKLARSISPTLIQYMFAERLAPNVNVMMVPSGQQFILGPDALRRQTEGR